MRQIAATVNVIVDVEIGPGPSPGADIRARRLVERRDDALAAQPTFLASLIRCANTFS